MIVVLMREQELDLQGAVDYVGALCQGTIQRFEDNRAMLPSWGDELDKQVATYVEGLQNWIVGSLHWSFDSERYFGKEGLRVKQNRVVKLLPKRPLRARRTWSIVVVVSLRSWFRVVEPCFKCFLLAKASVAPLGKYLRSITSL